MRKITLLFLSILLCLLTNAQKKDISLEEILIEYSLFPKGFSNLKSMNSGEHYSILKKIDDILKTHQPDVIINFFDLLIGLYYRFYKPQIKLICVGHQYIYFHQEMNLIQQFFTFFNNIIQNKPLPVYGKGENVRDWLYVLDHCKGIELAFKTGISGETYNIGGRNERNNLQIVDTVCSILNDLKPKASK